MPRTERLVLIEEIQKIRKSTVICYLTSIRPNVQAHIAEDQVRVMFDHLLRLPTRPVDKLDLFLVSNGGSGVVPWRLVSVFREFAKSFNVLIPYRAYSAASLIALGADEIVMHPFGELGPIDPTVSNEFNPKNPQGQPVGISVEDVKAYVNFIKRTVGITHEDELIKAVEILAQQVHPLALGNVERFVSQSRMIATKILKTHKASKKADHVINEMVENMTSKLYFHGHPINRKEAGKDLGLAVSTKTPANLESAMWKLYLDYEAEFKNNEVLNPPGDLFILRQQQLQQQAQQQGQPGQPPQPVTTILDYDLLVALIECANVLSKCSTKRRFLMYENQMGIQVQEQVLSQVWTHS